MSETQAVALVGAGPGDPELLTVKAQRHLMTADAVIYDRLVSQAILDLIPAGVTRICAGKAPGRHLLTQDEINALLVRLASSGRRVVRLKGGDPFVFGRGGEEAMHLAAAGIPFEVVPGVTAASACLAAAGIPLTHRGLAQGARLITGHCRDGGTLDIDWSRLADPSTTLVVYMALGDLGRIRDKLIAAGLPRTTPAAAIASGTLPEQQICRARIAELPEEVRKAGLNPPVLVVVGSVVALGEILGARANVEEVGDARERLG